MELARREVLLAGGLVAGALAAASPRVARAVAAGGPVAIYDPALPASRQTARTLAASGARMLPLAGDRVRFWQAELAAHRSAIAGCTRWSDLVVLRGLAAEHGFRLRAEERKDGLFAWVLA